MTASPNRGSAGYQLLLLALVASAGLLGVSATGKLAEFFRATVALEVRHGLLADRPLSIVLASAADSEPVDIAAEKLLASAGAALVVFEGDSPVRIAVGGRAADLAWLDGGLAVRAVDAGVDGEIAAPRRSMFLLVLPAGYADRINLRTGERLQLI